jgi:hydrogenase large subunit
MNARVVVDPITRIEGHLRVEAQMNGDTIASAYSSGTMVRGIEIILQGRDPRDAWAFAQRICGVCTLVHGIASVRSVEDALQLEVPKNAQLIRNLMIGAQYVHDHTMHFYHLHAGAEHLELPEFLARLLRRRAEEGEDLRGAGTARHLRQSLLGTPRLQVAA